MLVGKLKALAGEMVLQPSAPFTVLAGVTSSDSCSRSLAESCRLPMSWQRGVRAAVLPLDSPVAIPQGFVAAVTSPAHLASSNYIMPLLLCRKSAPQTWPAYPPCQQLNHQTHLHSVKMHMTQARADCCLQRAWRSLVAFVPTCHRCIVKATAWCKNAKTEASEDMVCKLGPTWSTAWQRSRCQVHGTC